MNKYLPPANDFVTCSDSQSPEYEYVCTLYSYGGGIARQEFMILSGQLNKHNWCEENRAAWENY